MSQYRVSDSIGCVAPQTLQSVHVAQGKVNKIIAIWQGSNGIYLFDNTSLVPIHNDIRDIFDSRNSSGINQTYIQDSVGFFDKENMEYHWLFASGTSTTLDKEFVYDVRRNKWYEIDRGTGKRLQLGLSVTDISGNNYTYGSIDTGYIERLENGNDFDGNDIVHELQTGDFIIVPEASPIHMMYENQIRKLCLMSVAKSNTTNNITLTHYPDSKTTGTEKIITPSSSGRRLTYAIDSVKFNSCSLNSIKLTLTTNNETVGFEPIALVGFYKYIRERISS
jgi:hypothetical protein